MWNLSSTKAEPGLADVSPVIVAVCEGSLPGWRHGPCRTTGLCKVTEAPSLGVVPERWPQPPRWAPLPSLRPFWSLCPRGPADSSVPWLLPTDGAGDVNARRAHHPPEPRGTRSLCLSKREKMLKKKKPAPQTPHKYCANTWVGGGCCPDHGWMIKKRKPNTLQHRKNKRAPRSKTGRVQAPASQGWRITRGQKQK